MAKNRKLGCRGFTLTEAVVVVVIIGVLAAVSVPVYLGYVQKSQLDLAKSTCEMVGAALVFAHNRANPLLYDGDDGNDWNALGISNPNDDFWTYTIVPPASANEAMGSGNTVTASPTSKCQYKSGQNVVFRPVPSGGDAQWVVP